MAEEKKQNAIVARLEKKINILANAGYFGTFENGGEHMNINDLLPQLQNDFPDFKRDTTVKVDRATDETTFTDLIDANDGGWFTPHCDEVVSKYREARAAQKLVDATLEKHSIADAGDMNTVFKLARFHHSEELAELAKSQPNSEEKNILLAAKTIAEEKQKANEQRVGSGDLFTGMVHSTYWQQKPDEEPESHWVGQIESKTHERLAAMHKNYVADALGSLTTQPTSNVSAAEKLAVANVMLTGGDLQKMVARPGIKDAALLLQEAVEHTQRQFFERALGGNLMEANLAEFAQKLQEQQVHAVRAGGGAGGWQQRA